jgi:hypothetical protein
MFEIAKELMAATKFSGFSLCMLSLAHKRFAEDTLILKKEDFSDDDVPGDNFPHILMNRHFDTR